MLTFSSKPSNNCHRIVSLINTKQLFFFFFSRLIRFISKRIVIVQSNVKVMHQNVKVMHQNRRLCTGREWERATYLQKLKKKIKHEWEKLNVSAEFFFKRSLMKRVRETCLQKYKKEKECERETYLQKIRKKIKCVCERKKPCILGVARCCVSVPVAFSQPLW